MSKLPKNQKAYCPLCSFGVTVADDTEEAECPNCTNQFQTNWGRIVLALRYKNLKAVNEKLVEALALANSMILSGEKHSEISKLIIEQALSEAVK